MTPKLRVPGGLRFNLGDASNWVRHTDPGTWVGHWLQGITYLFVGYLGVRAIDRAADQAALFAGFYGVTTCFGPRELGNLWDYSSEHGFREAVRVKGLDGWMDLMSPYMGMGTGIAGITGGPQGFLAGLLASAAVIGMVAFATRKKRRGKR